MANKEKKLERLKRSPHGWAYDTLETLVVAFGFEFRGGTNHAYYVDPDDEKNLVRIPRHKPVREYIVHQVVDAIEKRTGRRQS
jgi:hypothetical protein